MPRSAGLLRVRPVCQVFDPISTPSITRSMRHARPILRTHDLFTPHPRSRQLFPAQKFHGRRLFASAASSASGSSPASPGDNSTREHGQTPPILDGQALLSITNMMAYVDSHKSKVLNHRGVPSEAEVEAALQACKVVADYIMDDSVQPQVSHMATELESTASTLLSIDPAQAPMSSDPSETSGIQISAQLRQMINMISDAAYAVLVYPPVFITPRLLQLYVDVQARLGKPESLPQVFHLYASKPMPREASGSLRYVKQNPNKAANAIEPKIIETALDAAIEAKNLDAAVGIIENGYKTKAFIRNKLLRQAVFPVGAFAATPLAAYALASTFSEFQETMNSTTATNVAFAGILAYVGFTASIGAVALMTANDHMRRVTWAQGVPLRTRWLREEERAALDKVACAWGFREEWRQGEEEGADWDALREYIGQRGMALDRTELMKGMD
ncbi:hypothetical protein F5X96DRAFT_678012 [Biscogniauxia mediterranea]|nr:hypothetical protein F5X96DRAFT_678012 [Biscogniauxia mediterranea]